jgi:hypothetical protein
MDFLLPVKKDVRETHNCIQEERLERIEGCMLEMLKLAPQIQLVLDQVAEHDRALRGNNGTIGVIAKVANSMGTIDDLGTTIRGRGEDPGIVGKIDKMTEAIESLKDDRKWVTRLIIGWVIVTLLGLFVLIGR